MMKLIYYCQIKIKILKLNMFKEEPEESFDEIIGVEGIEL